MIGAKGLAAYTPRTSDKTGIAVEEHEDITNEQKPWHPIPKTTKKRFIPERLDGPESAGNHD